jgi:hypothetical protein
VLHGWVHEVKTSAPAGSADTAPDGATSDPSTPPAP